MPIKPIRNNDREVIYSNIRWAKLETLRKKAISIMETLETAHFQPIVHGSVARGDVKINSDVDIFIAEVQNSFLVEAALEKGKIAINSRWIVQATPNFAMKAHIKVDDTTTITFPLMNMRRVERDFYRFGGEVNLKQLKTSTRLMGVDKRLALIEPTKQGHFESSIIGKEAYVACMLGVSTETVLDRVHVLTRRDSIGRTGVFIKKELDAQETFELALKKVIEANPAVRRRYKL